MTRWFLLAGNEPEELKKYFSEFYTFHNMPKGTALWKWKKTCWICSQEKFRDEILASFTKYGIIEFSSAPSYTDVEFMSGDKLALENRK